MQQHFAETLRNLRKEKGITQAELARQLYMNKSMISAYEKESRMPSLDVLIKMSEFFNVTLDYLLGVEREHTNDKDRTIDVSGLNDKQINALKEIIKAFRE